MIPINYHHLFYFWTAARSGSISQATKTLYLSQPSLSKQLKELEEFCKFRLLQRSRKGVALTREGRIVFSYCERIFNEGEQLASLLRTGLPVPSVLRLGAESLISRDIIMHMLEFANRKSLKVQIFNGALDLLGAKLRQQALDIVVSNENLAAQFGHGYRSRLVDTLPLHFVGNAKFKAAVKNFPESLSQIPVLLRPPGHPIREQADEFFRRNRIFANVEAELEDVDLIRRLALEGRGIIIINPRQIADELRSGRLVKLHQKPVGIQERIWFTCVKEPAPNPAVDEIVDELMRNFKLAY